MGFFESVLGKDVGGQLDYAAGRILGTRGNGTEKLPTYPKTAAETELEQLLAASAMASLTNPGGAPSELAGIASGRLPQTWQTVLNRQTARNLSAVNDAAYGSVTESLGRLASKGLVNSSLADRAAGTAAKEAAKGANDAMGAAATGYLSMLDRAANLAMQNRMLEAERKDSAWKKAFDLYDTLYRTRMGATVPVRYDEDSPGLIDKGVESFFGSLGTNLGGG